jgi:hypothetical protein
MIRRPVARAADMMRPVAVPTKTATTTAGSCGNQSNKGGEVDVSEVDVMSDVLLNESETAKRMSCSVALLRKWRLFRKGPAYVNIGRLVKYPQSSINAFIEEHRVETSGER